MRGWNIKQHIQYFIYKKNLDNIVSIGATRGSGCAEICFLGDLNYFNFKKKFHIIETEYMKGYLTKSSYSDNFATVSFVRK